MRFRPCSEAARKMESVMSIDNHDNLVYRGVSMKRSTSKFGRTLREARLRTGEPQHAIAKDVGMLQSVLSELEIGTHRSEPSARMIVRLAKRLRLDPIEMLRLGRKDFRVWKRAFEEVDK